MMSISEIVAEFRKSIFDISDIEVEELIQYSVRKMKSNGITDIEYLPLLFEDEIKNYALRNAINATTELRRIGGIKPCVQSV